jgi:DNA (cytosine-5)-methyltransferase 1
MRFLSLFAGIGGFDLGLERAGMKCIGQVENDPYCIKVLEKHWPDVPRWGDIRDVTEETLADASGVYHQRRNTGTMGGTAAEEKERKSKIGRPSSPVGNGCIGSNQHQTKTTLPPISLICGGFPCQPWSGAGKRRGTEDDRDLWPEMLRIIETVRPRWVIGENVRNFVSMEMGLERSISDLENISYAVQAFIVGAVSVDAPHKRDRCWIIGSKNGTHPNLFRSHREGLDQHGEAEPTDGQEREPGSVREVLARQGDTEEWRTEDVADGESARRETRGGDRVGIADRPRRDKRQSPGSSSEAGAVADAKGEPKRPRLRKDGTDPNQRVKPSDSGGNVPNPDSGGRALWGDGQLPATSQVEGRGPDNGERAPEHEPRQRWLPEPDVGRVAHGVPQRVDRLKCLGNAVVPQVVERIGYAILKAEGVNEQNPLD